MEDLLLEFDEKTSEMKDLVEQLKTHLGDKPIPKSVRDALTSFYQSVNTYVENIEANNIEQISESAKMVSVYGQIIGQSIPNFKEADEEVIELGNTIYQKADEYRELIESSPLEVRPLDANEIVDNSKNLHNYNSIKRKLGAMAADHENHDQRIKKLLNENERKVNQIDSDLKVIGEQVSTELEKVKILYDSSLTEIESKKEQVNEILGHVSGRAIAGDYEKSAAEEKVMANWLRYGSLFCMALIVLVVGYSFWETTTADFKWQNSVFRIVLAFMLSVPAAYLARESAKHREQQYSHLQVSLDLKAITPYIASLPESEQHKLKVDIASRLFAAKDFSRVGADPYPLNSHEIIMELIKKLDVIKPTVKSSTNNG